MTTLDIGAGACGLIFPEVSLATPPAGIRAIVTPCQTHTCNVGVAVSPADSFPDTDALITMRDDIAVGVRTADCVPVLLHCPDIHAVAAIHAGWKGTLGRIIGATIGKLKDFGADPGNIHAAIGPCICGHCYEVGDDLSDRFISAGLAEDVVRDDVPDPCGERDFNKNTIRLDLRMANRLILLDCGVRKHNIHESGICTRHSIMTNPVTGHSFRYPSWRRDGNTSLRLLTVAHLLSR